MSYFDVNSVGFPIDSPWAESLFQTFSAENGNVHQPVDRMPMETLNVAEIMNMFSPQGHLELPKVESHDCDTTFSSDGEVPCTSPASSITAASIRPAVEAATNDPLMRNTLLSHRRPQLARCLQRLRASNEHADRYKTLLPVLPPSDQNPPAPTSKKVSKSRKRTEKIQCEVCFVELSGEHEYARHTQLLHQELGWRFEVIDPTEKGLLPKYDLKLGIYDCRNCRKNKLYGNNYNTAAHLRRIHFKTKASSQTSKLGGSSGGDWPAIEYLEYYHMKRVLVEQIPGTDGRKSSSYRRTGIEAATEYREPGAKKQKRPRGVSVNTHQESVGAFSGMAETSFFSPLSYPGSNEFECHAPFYPSRQLF